MTEKGEAMYGKVLAAAGGAYLLTFEYSVLPPAAGVTVLFVAGSVLAADFSAGGPQRRVAAFLNRIDRRVTVSMNRFELRLEIERAAREELAQNHGIRMADELLDEDREWLRDQAALAVAAYEDSRRL